MDDLAKAGQLDVQVMDELMRRVGSASDQHADVAHTRRERGLDA